MKDKPQTSTTQTHRTTSSPVDQLISQDQALLDEASQLVGTVIDTLPEFSAAIAQCQLVGEKELIVTRRIMEYFAKGQNSFTYGNPGVHVIAEEKQDIVRTRLNKALE